MKLTANDDLNLKILVYDYDYPDKDDLIGRCKIDLSECLKKPNEQITGFYKLSLTPKEKRKIEMKAKQSCGKIQIKCSWVPHEEVSGILSVRVIHARNLYPVEGKTSDPFCKVILPNDEHSETNFQSENLNPVWN